MNRSECTTKCSHPAIQKKGNKRKSRKALSSEGLKALENYTASYKPQSCVFLDSDSEELPIYMNGKLVVGVDLSSKVFRVMTVLADHQILNFDAPKREFLEFLKNSEQKYHLVFENCSCSSATACWAVRYGHTTCLIDPFATAHLRGRKFKDDGSDAAAIRKALLLGIKSCTIKNGDYRTLQNWFNDIEADKKELEGRRKRMIQMAHNDLIEMPILRSDGGKLPEDQESISIQFIKEILKREDRTPWSTAKLQEILFNKTYRYCQLGLYYWEQTARMTYSLLQIPVFVRLLAVPCIGVEVATRILLSSAGVSGVKDRKAFLAKYGVCPAHGGAGGKVDMYGLSHQDGHPAVKPALYESIESYLNSKMSQITKKKNTDKELSASEKYVERALAIMPREKFVWKIANKVMSQAYFILDNPEYEYDPEISCLGGTQKAGPEKVTRMKSEIRKFMKSLLDMFRQRIRNAAAGTCYYNQDLKQTLSLIKELEPQFMRTADAIAAADLMSGFKLLFVIADIERDYNNSKKTPRLPLLRPQRETAKGRHMYMGG